ncbi:MAG: metal-dependent hydrolase [Patescibacteria group bacterium]
MIFAHAPAGFVFAYLFKNSWQKKLSRQWIHIFYLIAIIGSLFPDIDLFYYYLFSAQISHREMPTHSFFIYAIIFLILFLIFAITKKRNLVKANILFFGGLLTHLLADSVGNGIMWLYPINHNLYGIASLNIIENSFISGYFFTINFFMEALFFSAVISIFSKHFISSIKLRKKIYYFLIIFLIAFLTALVYINAHLFSDDLTMYYSDYNHNGIINKHDEDIDGDGMQNINDSDIDGDGILNSIQLAQQINLADGIFYDPLNGKFLEIPLRTGFINNSEVIVTVFDNIGLFLSQLMADDFAINPDNYISSPKNKNFARSPNNWQAFLSHHNRLFYNNNKNLKPYDILFLDENYVALLMPDNKIMEADTKQGQVKITSLEDLVSRHGPVIKIGRLLVNE